MRCSGHGGECKNSAQFDGFCWFCHTSRDSMTALSIILEGDGALQDVRDRTIIEGAFTRVVVLDHGMASGKPSVGVVVELPDGTVAFGQTSLSLFLSAADAFRAKHGDPRL